MPGKYSPLEEYLRKLPASQREVRLSFTQIEGILKSKLPASAQEQSWWDHATEGNHRNTTDFRILREFGSLAYKRTVTCIKPSPTYPYCKPGGAPKH